MQKLDSFEIPVGFRGRSPFIVQFWWFVDFFFFKLSPQFLYGWRRFLLRLFGAKIGKGVIIRPSVTVTYPWKIKIGDYSWIGDNVELYSLGEIQIGNNVVISQKSYLCGGSHDYEMEDFSIWSKKIIVEDECWLATDVYVGPGVKIGKGTVVGARSSVFSNLPAKMICLGSPAKVLKERSTKNKIV
ncbi:putative colanic acid biosynthesis acetyltransferase [Labilibacter marinus]|uniref:putative colanic acid biosynthesis acetyltransferase n=1 Tax=Labilibacter marinus TaxID=1477105 RepID=UPI00094F8D38|nr:putative colanic acid biosynthesis acetyltransferase [Labilibacter marinus]